MDDVMYKVHMRDSDFMKVQTRLQTLDLGVTNQDPTGTFEYVKHIDMGEKLSNKRHNSVRPRQMEHLLPTMKEQEEHARSQMKQKHDLARNALRLQEAKKNPPMNDREKQAALKDRMKLIKTMERANEMIDNKYKPTGTAQSLSPYLVANAVGFDSIKMMNRIEED